MNGALPAIANKDPHVAALAQELAAAMGVRLNAPLAKLEEVLERVRTRVETVMPPKPGGPDHPSEEACACPRKGLCHGTCDPCKKKACRTFALSHVDTWAALMAGLRTRGCRVCCRPMSPCLLLGLQWMLTRVSDRRMYKILELDDDSVEINTFIGDTTDFVDITTTPLIQDKQTLLVMSPTQLAPWVPGVSKAAVLWEGDPANAGVELTLHQGPKGLTNIKEKDLAGFAQIGNPKNLERWFCVDRCFVRPFPPFLGCAGGLIPDTEAVYLKIKTDNSLGPSKLKRLPFEILKAGTFMARKYCDDCGINCDDFGVPLEDIS